MRITAEGTLRANREDLQQSSASAFGVSPRQQDFQKQREDREIVAIGVVRPIFGRFSTQLHDNPHAISRGRHQCAHTS